MAFWPPPSQICSSSLRMPETRSARKRMLASKRAVVGSTLEVRMELSEAMFRDCYVKPVEGKGANLGCRDVACNVSLIHKPQIWKRRRSKLRLYSNYFFSGFNSSAAEFMQYRKPV